MADIKPLTSHVLFDGDITKGVPIGYYHDLEKYPLWLEVISLGDGYHPAHGVQVGDIYPVAVVYRRGYTWRADIGGRYELFPHAHSRVTGQLLSFKMEDIILYQDYAAVQRRKRQIARLNRAMDLAA